MTEQSFNDLWARYMPWDVTQLTPADYASRGRGWNMTRLLRDLRELWRDHPTDPMTPAEIADVANTFAAEFEKRGYPMTECYIEQAKEYLSCLGDYPPEELAGMSIAAQTFVMLAIFEQLKDIALFLDDMTISLRRLTL